MDDVSTQLLERIAVALETIAATMGTESPSSLPKSRTATEAAAITLVYTERITSINEIAERLGVHRSTVYRWEKLKEVIRLVKLSN